MSTPSEYRFVETLSYSPNTHLNTVDVYLPQGKPVDDALWLIFIHGGAWRDNLLNAKDIQPVLPFIPALSSENGPASEHERLPIAGVASINYRLSSYPDHPDDPSDDSDVARNVMHPAHLHDTRMAVGEVIRKYKIGLYDPSADAKTKVARYILLGHSCGATLTFQPILNISPPEPGLEDGFVLPIAAIGLEGIYDLSLLSKSFPDPFYTEFMEVAFGRQGDGKNWEDASPATARGVSFDETWRGGQVAVVAHSSEDVLVDQLQADIMMKRLGAENKFGRTNLFLELKENHGQVVSNGIQTAKAIRKAFELLAARKS